MRSRLLNAELHHHRHGLSARRLSDVINLQSNVARPDLQSNVVCSLMLLGLVSFIGTLDIS